MTDEIKTRLGAVVGSWDGVNIDDLKNELARIRLELRNSDPADKVISHEMPHRDQVPEDLQKFNAYPIWGHDQQGNCLCGARANRVVSAEDVRQYSMVEHH